MTFVDKLKYNNPDYDNYTITMFGNLPIYHDTKEAISHFSFQICIFANN